MSHSPPSRPCQQHQNILESDSQKSAIEINVGIIAGCFIALPPLLKKYPVRSFTSWSFDSLRRRLLRKSEERSRRSNKTSADPSFHVVSLHLPTAGGFTELREGPKSVSEESLKEQSIDSHRHATEAATV